MMRAGSCAAFLMTAALGATPEVPTTTFTFARAIGNVEYDSGTLRQTAPGQVRRVPGVAGMAWYGRLMHRVAEDAVSSRSNHLIPFVAEYQDGVAVRAWCDADFDGDLTNQPPIQLAGYPSLENARSFLVDLTRVGRLGGREVPIKRKIRVVLESYAGARSDAAPGYRVQVVEAMMGTVTLEGKPHRAFLHDGNADGFYTRDQLDGLFVDLDDNGHVDVDQMSPEFGSFTVPFTMGRRSYQVASLDPEGRELSLRNLGPASELPPAPMIGQPAPEFSYTDTDGRLIKLSDYRGRPVLLYFWASWCWTCKDQAEPLKRLYERYHPAGLEIVGVSYDTDRGAMNEFRQRHGHPWPTSFSGRQVWEDPIGKLYRERGAGVLYLIGPSGILEGSFSILDDLEPRLAPLASPEKTFNTP